MGVILYQHNPILFFFYIQINSFCTRGQVFVPLANWSELGGIRVGGGDLTPFSTETWLSPSPPTNLTRVRVMDPIQHGNIDY